jgi:MFS superfamily sulfate permease-like transporter
MYLLFLFVLIVIGIVSVAFTPIFGVIIAAVGFVVFLVWNSMQPRADEKSSAPEETAARPQTREAEGPKGAWGQPKP